MQVLRLLLVLTLFFTANCSALVQTRGQPGKISLVMNQVFVDRTMIFGVVNIVNLSPHRLAGEVTCAWYLSGTNSIVLAETRNFYAPTMANQHLEFSTMNDRKRLRLSCEITKLIHADSHLVMIDKTGIKSSSAYY